MKRKTLSLAVLLILGCAISLDATDAASYRSPFELAFSPDGKLLAVTDHTAGKLTIVDVDRSTVTRTLELGGKPAGVVWSVDGTRVYAADYGGSTVVEVIANSGRVARRIPVGLRPMGVALAPARSLLITAVTATDEVSFVDTGRGEEKARIRVPREPHFVAVTSDSSLAAVGNLLPAGSAEDPKLASVVSLIDLENLRLVANVPLPPGSTSVRELTLSPDDRFAYVAHTLGRFNVPATQLGRGWVNTNALSVIDLRKKERHATVLLDHPYEGAADPWGLALAAGGEELWISLRGVHQLARVKVGKLQRLLSGEPPTTTASRAGQSAGDDYDVWRKIQSDPSERETLVNDLGALHAAGLIKRFPLPGKGPRGLDVSPDGKRLAVALYYSGSVVFVESESGEVTSTVSLGPEGQDDPVRRGEALFHDAEICFQHWMSCSTCHPDNGRTDGLRWDLPNDGLGTPQRTRSLLFSHRIFPTTARGVREGIHDSVPKGLLFLRRMPEPELVESLIAYLKSLEPEPSPYLVDGELSVAARRGKELFEGKAKCVRCHEGELGTDLRAHDVGTLGKFGRTEDVFYTPKLVELYRTAPYLHDGRAATLKEVFTKHDPEGKHGRARNLTPTELDDLIEYLNSL